MADFYYADENDLSALLAEVRKRVPFSGTCTIAAGTAAKTVTGVTGFELRTHAAIRVKFNKANTASNPTLNVNGTGAKNIFHRGERITTGVNKALLAGVCEFEYDGTQWHLVGNYYDSDTHQTIKQDGVTGATGNRFGTCSTAADTAAKVMSITTGTFTLGAGARVSVKFTNANTANNPTLNVNSTGAKNIFHRGERITTGVNKALLAGACDFVYDGTQWHLVGNYYDILVDSAMSDTSTNPVQNKVVQEQLTLLNDQIANLNIAYFDSTDNSIVFRSSEVARFDEADNSIVINI